MSAVEQLRVQEHLLGAERAARSRDVRHLDPPRQMTRALLLDELADYRLGGVFPRNEDFVDPTPAFIDAHGTRCAMAHLMELGGASELVAEIAATRNHAFVAELASDPRVVAWLDAAGLTVDEAARIQPAYCPTSAAECVCGRPPAAVAKATVMSVDAGVGALRLDEIAGSLTGSCAAYTVGSTLSQDYPPPKSGTVSTVTAELKGTGPECRIGVRYFASQDGAATCLRGSAVTLPTDVSANDLFAALSSSDCQAALAARERAWSDVPACMWGAHSDDGATDNVAGGGCSTSGDHSAATGTVATAVILAALFVARARRRRAH